jgi:rare lipoprotein A
MDHRFRFISGLLLLGALLWICGCGHPESRPAQRQAKAEGDGRYVRTGTASWYGPGFHGRQTANGEKYNMHAYTAAHRFLPFGTRVAVTNLDNGRSVRVRINDRGPFVKNRIIDLSRAAAEKIGMLDSGTAPVRLRILGQRKAAEELQRGSYYVQAGSFSSRDNARKLLRAMKTHGYEGTRVQRVEVGGRTFWRVQAGVFPGLHSARQALRTIRRDHPSSFIIAD